MKQMFKDNAKKKKKFNINNLFHDAVSFVSIGTGVVCAYVMGEHARRPYWVLAVQDWHTFTPCLSPSAVRDRGEALLICLKQSNKDSQRWRARGDIEKHVYGREKLAYKQACKTTFVLLWQWVFSVLPSNISIKKPKPISWITLRYKFVWVQDLKWILETNPWYSWFTWCIIFRYWRSMGNLNLKCEFERKKKAWVWGWGASLETHRTIELWLPFCFLWLRIGGFVLVMTRAWLNACLNCNV